MENKKKVYPVKALMSKAIDPAALVNYEAGAIVSKTVIAKTGTVTLFAFDEEQGLSAHSAPFDALVQVLDGEARMTIAWQAAESECRRDGHHACK